MALALAVLLGARHATDPDHLTAVSTLILSDDPRGGRRAAWLGLFWGLGHAVTLFLFGLPVVLIGRGLPESLQRAAEFAVGLLITGLAVRLLVRWRRGYFHAHPHDHGAVHHTHPHVHEHATGSVHPHAHQHAHEESMGRTPLAAFAIGLVHGAGGSAGAGVLLVATMATRGQAVWALLLFSLAAAMSMAVVSSAVGYALVRGAVAPRLARFVPVLGCLSLIFGIWYAIGAIG